MIRLMFSEVVDAVGGQIEGELPHRTVSGVSTDTRVLRQGELFFAVRGERFDGHDFACTALQRGAAGAVIARDRCADVRGALRRAETPEEAARSIIAVDDPVAALGRLARYHTQQLSAHLIAVVGSNGKTTTKAMIDHLLAQRFTGRASPKSFNNQIGVPLTLLTADAGDDYLVVEIGTNAPGEVAALAELVSPDLSVITSIGEEHLEGFGDLGGVLREETSVLNAQRAGGFAAVNLDTPQIRAHLEHAGLTLVTFGRSEDADLRVTDVRLEAPWLHFSLNGRFQYRLRAVGAHNAVNAAGAIAIARRLGLGHEELAQRLETVELPPMRSEVSRIGTVTLINDAYNANPPSVLAAIRTLEDAQPARRRIFVFGEMRELGRRSAQLHGQIAERLRESRVDHVVLVGDVSRVMCPALGRGGLFAPEVTCVGDVDECVAALGALLQDGDVVLLKASRAVGLERVVEPLRRQLTTRVA